ncbi:hypothetical protein PENANT_c026G07643 [Penicillium antarcticum]|uniref:Thiolase-like protein type 1 additional C-terminal domain-containing protein n=1 Tax=Penicillium antarcticum TaxID=416450 RepID=A0A1V6PYX8_9EURO|nr:hypothetical protein PENANT_c026G07643 [Penicillium antarcticum]
MPPIIIGVADIRNRSVKVEDAKEPATLMLEAIQGAINDATSSAETAQVLQNSIDSISVVRTWTWPYRDLPGLLSQELGVNPQHRLYSDHGGNQPAKLLDEAATRIEKGETKVAVLTGGEALASYPLLMNAFNTVNLSSACILTSTEYATQLGISSDRWIYPLGGAGFSERDNFWDRPNFFESSAISKSLDICLERSHLALDDIDLYDLYSCFPIVPKLACHHLGLSIIEPQKPLSLLGGLTSFGGAGNNYSMHAITEMTRQLRDRSSRNGLILANGGILSYQHALCLSSQAPQKGRLYPDNRSLSLLNVDMTPSVDFEAEGKAIIETYTIEFTRDGNPLRAYIVGRIADTNHRFLANESDQATLLRLSSMEEEPIGKTGFVSPDPEGERGQRRNLFSLDSSSKL